MTRSIRLTLFLSPILIIVIFLPAVARPAPVELLIAYGGHNETVALFGWVLIEVCSRSTMSIPEYCRPAAARS